MHVWIKNNYIGHSNHGVRLINVKGHGWDIDGHLDNDICTFLHFSSFCTRNVQMKKIYETKLLF